MLEKMLSERRLKEMQDKASSDYEAQQIPNKMRKTNRNGNLSLDALQSSLRSPKTKKKKKKEPGRKNELPIKDEISTKTFSTAMITEIRRQWIDISKLL